MIKAPKLLRTQSKAIAVSHDSLDFGSQPFFFGATIKDYQKMGRGVLRVGVAFTANTDTTVAHNLGRIPQAAVPFLYVNPTANPPASAVYVPKYKPSTVTAWTSSNITLQADTTVTAANAPILWII
jgi:hypothetical protein